MNLYWDKQKDMPKDVYTLAFLNRLLKAWKFRKFENYGYKKVYPIVPYVQKTVLCLEVDRTCNCEHGFPHLEDKHCHWQICPKSYKYLNCKDMSLFKVVNRPHKGFNKGE